MRVLHTADELTAFPGCSFVPTMGALHDGHLALIRRGAEFDQPVVVSIFVNPTQFSPDEDYQKYTRNLEQDTDHAAAAGATAIFAPALDVMYPDDQAVPVPMLPSAATQPQLEDKRRPGHMAGVCQVVARLFDLVRPAITILGEKDFQQQLVITQLVQAMHHTEPDRWGDMRLETVPTVREADGLALSSRNSYLDPQQRSRAAALSQALHSARLRYLESPRDVTPDDLETIMFELLRAHDLRADYAVVRDAQTLLPINNFDQPARALIAAHVDDIRLIDNMAIN